MSEVATRIILIRHGAVENPDNVIYGRRGGFYLSGEGKTQVQEFAEILKSRDVVFDTIYTSPLMRAVETASILQDSNGFWKKGRPATVINVREELNDVESPILEGQSMSLISEIGFGYYQTKYALWCIESPKQQIERTRRLVDEIVRNDKGKTVGLVTHGDPARFLLWSFQPLGRVNFTNFRDEDYLGTAEAVLLNFDGEGQFVGYEHIKRSGAGIETKASGKFKEAT